jgi:DNA polymerase delta subunit 1
VVRRGPPPTAHVRKIIELGRTTSYVYDLETENHHFHVGPGNLIVHNTDSVMVKFDTKDAKSDLEMREISFRLGEEAADRISKTFKYPIELEFEKCYQPYLLFSKKRYAGLMYTQVEQPDYIDAKGIQLVRRDNAPFVKDISKQVLNMIMYDQDVLGSIDKVQDVARKLLNYEFPVDQLVISKSMRNDYVNRNQPHLKVAEKIEQRNPGAGPKSGERVPYIIMDNGERLLCDRAEDPVYVVDKKLDHKVDVLYYLTNGLISPLESFYDLFMDHSKEGIFGDMIRAFENKRKGLRNGSTLNQFFERTNEIKTPEKKGLQKKSAKKTTSQQRTIDLFF